MIAQGDHKIMLDSDFSAAKDAFLKVEFKTLDKGETITSK
jgi:hypothetical protein